MDSGFTRSRFHLKKPLSLLLQEATPHPLNFYHVIEAIQTYLQILLLILIVSATTSAVTSFTENLKLSKSSVRVGIDFFQTPVPVDIVTFSHESQMFLMASRMVNPFQKVLN